MSRRWSVVCAIEEQLAAYGRHADGVAVAADACDHAAQERRSLWVGGRCIAGIVQVIKAALSTAPIEETQDHAAMVYDGGGTVSLLREIGLWRIQNLK